MPSSKEIKRDRAVARKWEVKNRKKFKERVQAVSEKTGSGQHDSGKGLGRIPREVKKEASSP